MNSQYSRETKVGVLDKAVLLLTLFSQEERTLTPQVMAEHSGLSLPTVYRLAQALCDHGFLVKDGPYFRLGMTLVRLGLLAAESIDVRRQALTHLRWLNEQTGENAELHMRQEETRMVVEVVSSPHNLRPFADVGALLPLHRGAAGKVLLAWLPRQQQEALITASAERFDHSGTFDRQRLFDELEQIKLTGWTVSDGERSSGVSAIAAPLFDSHNSVAGAIAVVAPTARLGEEHRTRYIPLVCEAARRVSYDLGYVHHDQKVRRP